MELQRKIQDVCNLSEMHLQSECEKVQAIKLNICLICNDEKVFCSNLCRKCYNKNWEAKNKEKRLLKRAKWKEENPGKYEKIKKDYYENNKECLLQKQKNKRDKLCPECKKNLIHRKYSKCKSCSLRNERGANWKGDNAGYKAIHLWVRKNKPKPEFCEDCNFYPPREVANISGNYKRDINDYKWLCRKCHHKMDKISEKSTNTKMRKINGEEIIKPRWAI